MAYTSKTLVENYLQRDLTEDEEALLMVLIPSIKIWIDNYTSSTFDQVSETIRYYDGGGSAIDIDPCTDVNAVTDINNDGTDSYAYTNLTEYVIEPVNSNVKNEIVRRYGNFPDGSRRMAVRAKFSEWDGGVPQDIEMIATRIVVDTILASSNSSTGNIVSESIEGHTINYGNINETVDQVATQDPVVKAALQMRRQLLVE